MRILFLTQRLPYAPNRGDRIRAYHLLRALQRIGTVDLVSLVHDAEEASHVRELLEPGLNVHPLPLTWLGNYARAACRLPSGRPLTMELLHSSKAHSVLRRIVDEHPPDVVVAYCSSMARYALEAPLKEFPFILDMVDVDSQKWAALGRSASQPMRLIYQREARCLSQFERRAIRKAAVTLVVNDREEAAVRELVPDARVRVMANGIDLAGFAPATPPAAAPRAVFCAVMNYAPNVEAARRLVTRIWPLVRAVRPDAQLQLVGAHPTPEVRGFSSLPGIEVTGAVPDVRPYLWNAAVGVAPLVTARGIQNKVLEALAAGLPVVTTPIVAEGIPQAALPGCLVADSDRELAGHIVELLDQSPQARSARAAAADLERLTWEQQLSGLRTVVTNAAALSHRTGSAAMRAAIA